MRNLLIGILLAGATVSPALAQDNGNDRWHHDQQQNGRGEGRAQRQQAQPQQQERGPRVNGGNFYRQQQGPQFAPPQQQVRVDQGQRGWNRPAFEGRAGVVPQAEVRQQGAWQGEQNRNGGWTRSYGYRNGGAVQQQQGVNGGWYGQRGVVQQQYRQGDRRAENGWNRNWRSDDRYDWRRYRDSHRSRFHLGLYIDPFGYGYQSFAIGYRLPPIYFGQQYWIDPAMYELPYPPPGTQWVRYWNDALLVDMYTGQVVDVIQGFFW